MLWQEFTSGTSDMRPYIYLSDGGHFENLGLYELLRRRLGLIIVSDVSFDPEYKCDDFGRAIEKCRADFSYEIRIDLEAVRKQKARYSIGEIEYGEGRASGVLVYLKPLVRKGDPEDLWSYELANTHFPHDSTSNQWFLESQFEAYRVLGEVTGREVVAALNNPATLAEIPERLGHRVRSVWSGSGDPEAAAD